ncbi:unnamed protein product [Fraxinus pennsylvanica]|uniref:DUF7642 domain-containing protein n=1 Tax=Fraxinus pennsylvanica TaxID=56036 RepID=A0AAD2DWL1_9LAMI|nr:unnamed protein product [Fraxinus pennsylvanica]
MESKDGVVEIDRLERGLLLPGAGSNSGSEPTDNPNEEEDEPVLYKASFEEAEENFMKYQTAQWVLYSLLLILAWGIGLFMLLYLPVRRYILRKDIRSRKLYITPNAIVYKVKRPVPIPFLGFLKKEKYVLLPSVADVVIEQGYLQSQFGVYSIRIENVGVRRPSSDDVQIKGVANPHAFRKAVLMRISSMREEVLPRQVSAIEDVPTSRISHSPIPLMSPSKPPRPDSLTFASELAILQKLEEVGSSVKRVQTLIEEKNSQASEAVD